MTLLHIDSSITGDASVSRKLSASVVARIAALHPGIAVTHRDLAADPIAHLTMATHPAMNPDALGDVREFLAADIVVIGAPMYNFTIPSQLKAWIDRVLVAGETFAYGANGPEGLAKGKRVILALSSGGLYGPGSPAESLEHLETYLRGVFGFMGIVPEIVTAYGLKVSPEAHDTSVAQALGEAARLAA